MHILYRYICFVCSTIPSFARLAAFGLIQSWQLCQPFSRGQDAIDALNDNYKSWAYFGDECWVAVLPYLSQYGSTIWKNAIFYFWSMSHLIWVRWVWLIGNIWLGPRWPLLLSFFGMKLHNVTTWIFDILWGQNHWSDILRETVGSGNLEGSMMSWNPTVSELQSVRSSEIVNSKKINVHSEWIEIGSPMSRIREEKDCKPMKVFIAGVGHVGGFHPYISAQFMVTRAEGHSPGHFDSFNGC